MTLEQFANLRHQTESKTVKHYLTLLANYRQFCFPGNIISDFHLPHSSCIVAFKTMCVYQFCGNLFFQQNSVKFYNHHAVQNGKCNVLTGCLNLSQHFVSCNSFNSQMIINDFFLPDNISLDFSMMFYRVYTHSRYDLV